VLARTRAHVAENQERRRPGLPALADVRTARLLTYRVQVQATHQALQPGIVLPARRADLQPLRLLPTQRLRRPVQDRQTRRTLGLDATRVLARGRRPPRGAFCCDHPLLPSRTEIIRPRARWGKPGWGTQFNGGCGTLSGKAVRPVRIPCGRDETSLPGYGWNAPSSASAGRGSSEDVLGMSRSIPALRGGRHGALGGTRRTPRPAAPWGSP